MAPWGAAEENLATGGIQHPYTQLSLYVPSSPRVPRISGTQSSTEIFKGQTPGWGGMWASWGGVPCSLQPALKGPLHAAGIAARP